MENNSLKIKKIFDLKDTVIDKKKLVHHPISNIKIYKQPDLILLYMGNDFFPILNKVTNAKKGDVSTSWEAVSYTHLTLPTNREV